MATIPVLLKPRPGVKRDGTLLEGDACVSAQWARWQRELPRKMGGYRCLSNDMGGIVRQIHTQGISGVVHTHVGHAFGIEEFHVGPTGTVSAIIDRTPVGLEDNPDYSWMFDAMLDATSGDMSIIAHPQSNLLDISDNTMRKAYIGDIYGTGALTEIPTDGVSGGIVVLHPYLFMYCENGLIKWSDANDPTTWAGGDAGDAYVSGSKVLKGLPLRGGSQSPAGLFWTMDSLIRCSYNGGASIFSFDTITSSTSVLSVNSIIEYDGIFFWAALDRFQMYNGVVREVPNQMNLNYFYDNINWTYRNKIFAYKVPRFGEIWWCYPRGDATECTHAIIYNLRENTWYDTELPNGGRSAGIYAQVFQSPLLTGVRAAELPAGDLRLTEAGDDRITEEGDYRITDTGPTTYKLWRHEYGVNEIDGTAVRAVNSYFETADVSLLLNDQPKDRALRCSLLEPDFVQTGDMQVQTITRINARAEDVYSEPRTFPDVATESYEQQVFFKEQGRFMRFRFASDTLDGDYQMGQCIAHMDVGDGRYQS